MSNEEIWKDIEGYEGMYQVSNYGRIRSVERNVNNGSGIYMIDEMIMHLPKNDKGYFRIGLRNGVIQKKHMVHRLVAQAFIPNPENKPQVNHIDGVKTNNNVSNLEWCTQSENMRHAYSIGLASGIERSGESNPMSRLTAKEVREIRQKHNVLNKSITELAQEHSCSRSHIWNIVNFNKWKHI